MLGLIALGGSLLLVGGEDFWWHLKLGEWMLAHGGIPRTGLFSAAHGESAFLYQPWLGGWLLAALHGVGGLGLLFVLRNGLLVVTYGLVGWQALRRSRNPRAAALGVLFAALGAVSAWDVRPAMFAWPLAALTFSIVSEVSAERWSRRALWALPVIQVLWVNLHVSFVLGPLLAGAAALGALLDRRFDHLEAPTYPTARALGFAPLAMLLACLVNPRGPAVFGHIWTLWTNPAVRLLGEWSSPFAALANPFVQLFGLSVLITLLAMAVVYEKLTARDWLLLAVALIPALFALHYQLWFGLVAGPLLADALARRGRLRLIKSTKPPGRLVRGGIAALAVVALLLQPPLRSLLPLPAALQGVDPASPAGRLSRADSPLPAVEYLAQQPPQGRLFHDWSAASYLIWRIGERTPAFVDPRAELYPLAEWDAYRCISRGDNWAALLDAYQVTALLLDTERQSPLISQLAGAGWTERFRQGRSVVFERTDALPAAVAPPVPACASVAAP